MSFPKRGKSFPGGGAGGPPAGTGNAVSFAEEIARALRQELGRTGSAVKTAARWTGASERTAKNWLAGTYAPSGEHLVALARHSEQVLATVLVLAGREDLTLVGRLLDVRLRMRQALALVESIFDDAGGEAGTEGPPATD